jgi:hypothetical protein
MRFNCGGLGFAGAFALAASIFGCQSREEQPDVARMQGALTLSPAEFELALTTPPELGFQFFAVAATHDVALDADAVVTRSQGDVLIANSLQGSTKMQPLASVTGDVYERTLLTMFPQSHVTGDAFTPSLSQQPNALLDGARIPWPAGELTKVEIHVEFPQETVTSTLVQPHQTSELAPGRHNIVRVSPTGKLRLQSGSYFLESLDLAPNSQVELAQTTGPTYIFAHSAARLLGTFPSEHLGLAILQTGPEPMLVGKPFRGAIVAPNAKLNLQRTDAPHRGAFYPRAFELEPGAKLVYEPPNVLVPLVYDPTVDLQACADAILPREDLTGDALEIAYQQDIARYCTMLGVDVCEADLTGRANAEYTQAAGALFGKLFTPAEYLALVNDRADKLAAAEDDSLLAHEICAEPDADGDWVPDDRDDCDDTPPLVATTDDGCTDSNLPQAPSAEDMAAVFERGGFISNLACSGAKILPKLPAGGFYYPGDRPRGTYILAGRVINQPEGCLVWYYFDVEQTYNDVTSRYIVAFSEREEATALVGSAEPVPGGFIQFNPRPADAGTRGKLGKAGGKHVRYRVKAMNGGGMQTGWSEWKTTTNDDCLALGFVCGGG